MTNRAYDWVAEGEREERSRLRAERRRNRSARRELTIRIVTWIAIFATGLATGWLLH